MNKIALAVVVIAILLVGVGWAAIAYLPGTSDSTTSAPATSTTSGGSSPVTSSVVATMISAGNSSRNWLTDSPAFLASSIRIDYPPNYGEIANFTLGVINAERSSAGLQNVTLSAVPSGQQHADSMAYYGYFSHWDNQGFKPYMRYTLLGGKGGVYENLALNYCNTSEPGT
ncbi:MAG TPA: hypothetical protein VGS04_00130, partial [Nitrososphaerales archaeon]|nr:hypothetical protein [Nitrososphaerales archaeon]